ncbi:MAG: hypothetical protein LC664_10095 [Flavobacteriales bacterium]|nr:hypothetical protein [Flavobacteriales bacterium]
MTSHRIKELIEQEVRAIQNIPVDGAIIEVVELIYEQVHQKGGKVVVSGMGKAGQINARSGRAGIPG